MKELIGKTIVAVRPMSDEELEGEMWDRSAKTPIVLVLSDGTLLYASRDGEGNGPGMLFGRLGKTGVGDEPVFFTVTVKEIS